VGNYFETGEPLLAATVESLNGTALVHAPESRVKYSNAAIATVGYVLEVTQGEPFATYLERAVLEPLGMRDSAFEPRPDLVARLARAIMWTADGRVSDAPTFQLGMAPAGSMYSTVTDLCRFMSALFAGGRGVEGRVLEEASLEAMWTPQFAEEGATSGYGIGFAVGELEGRRRVGHGGAIYGFSTSFEALPDEGLGVVVVASKDVTNAVTDRLALAALRLLLAAREGAELPAIPTTEPVDEATVERLAGHYRGGERVIELAVRDGALVVFRDGIPMTVRAVGSSAATMDGAAERAGQGAPSGGDTLVIDDELLYGTPVVPLEDGVRVGGATFTRFTPERPAPPPARWEGLIGEYGWDHNTLYVLERGGRLHALIEWFFEYPLEEVSETEYRFPDHGLYEGESLIFTLGEDGRATEVEAASVVFERRAVGTEAGETFRITPARPVEELRAEALAAEPPEERGEFREADLVDLATIDAGIRFDVRYATTDNFMSSVFYTLPKAFLQRPAAEALGRAQRALAADGYGLLVHDAYRPWYVTKMFWDATPEDLKVFVADPSQGSRHNRGSAVDLTLYDADTGEPVRMVGGYDEFSPRSYPDYPGGTSRQRWLRGLLRARMEAEGFTVYEAEWWHFDHADWRSYAIQNATFEEILAAEAVGAGP
jgi:D-alanyl-D-alanine dipeptidase